MSLTVFFKIQKSLNWRFHMSTASISTPPAFLTPGRSDLNYARVRGRIVSIRPRPNGLILMRVRVGETQQTAPALLPAEEGDRKDPPTTIVTLALPDGQIDGKDASAFVGDRVCFSGWVCDLPYDETFQSFLGHCKKASSDYPELAELLPITVRRSETCIIPEEYTRLEPDDTREAGGEENFVRVEGVIARVWEYGNANRGTPNRYTRIAIYDRHIQRDGNGKQTPHYLSVQFTHGQVDGREVTVDRRRDGVGNALKPGDRIRVTGRFIHRRYWEDLRDFLGDARRIDLLTRLPNSDTLVETLRGVYLQTSVEAINVIQYT
jgi:hypothetical protein